MVESGFSHVFLPQRGNSWRLEQSSHEGTLPEIAWKLSAPWTAPILCRGADSCFSSVSWTTCSFLPYSNQEVQGDPYLDTETTRRSKLLIPWKFWIWRDPFIEDTVVWSRGSPAHLPWGISKLPFPGLVIPGQDLRNYLRRKSLSHSYWAWMVCQGLC